MKTNKDNKTEMQALYTAYDIHRRVAMLAAMWTAFDPFGAVVYWLRGFENAAWTLREVVYGLKSDWDYTKEPYHSLRPIKDGDDKYETFKNHIKGIEGAMRRLEANPWIDMVNHTTNKVRIAVEGLREHIRSIRMEV